MPHTTEIVEVVNRSDGEYFVKVQCCGTSEISTFTVNSSLGVDAIAAGLADHRQRAAELHESHLRAAEHLQGLVGTKVEH